MYRPKTKATNNSVRAFIENVEHPGKRIRVLDTKYISRIP